MQIQICSFLYIGDNNIIKALLFITIHIIINNKWIKNIALLFIVFELVCTYSYLKTWLSCVGFCQQCHFLYPHVYRRLQKYTVHAWKGLLFIWAVFILLIICSAALFSGWWLKGNFQGVTSPQPKGTPLPLFHCHLQFCNSPLAVLVCPISANFPCL